MANATSPSGRAGACGCVTRGDLYAVAIAAMLCSATYGFSIWHNSRGDAQPSVLGPIAAATSAAFCANASADDELDFESHHAAENAGLSVSAANSSARRALRGRGRFPIPATRGAVVWTTSSARSDEAAAGGGKRWPRRVDGDTGSMKRGDAAQRWSTGTSKIEA